MQPTDEALGHKLNNVGNNVRLTREVGDRGLSILKQSEDVKQMNGMKGTYV